MTILEFIQSWFKANKAFYKELKMKQSINRPRIEGFTDLHSEVLGNADPTFVLGTGRSGTQLLTKILDMSSDIRSYHEPSPEFSFHNRFAFENQDNLERLMDMFDAARYELIRDQYLLETKYIETNNRVTFFAHAIAKLYPNAKFIHLVRSPEKFVESGINRGWYSDQKLHDESRIMGKGEEWDAMSQMDKITWLWQETHAFIENFKTKNSNVLTVMSSELFKDPKTVKAITDHIGIKPLTPKKVASVIKKPVNKNKSTKKKLTAEEKEAIRNRAPIADKYFTN